MRFLPRLKYKSVPDPNVIWSSIHIYCIVLYCIVLVNWSIHSWRLYNMIYFVIFCVIFWVIAIDVERPIFRWTPWEAFQDHFEEGGMCILMERWLFVTNLQELLKSLTVQHREFALRENNPAGGLPPCFVFISKKGSLFLCSKTEICGMITLPWT